MKNIIKRLMVCFLLLFSTMEVVLAQERINEFVVTSDESHNPTTIYSSYGATPKDGVVIINSTIPNLEFGIMSVAKERLRKVVPDKRKNRYVLIIQPNDSNYKHYTITINAKGYKQGKIDSVVVTAGSSSGYIVNPKDPKGLPLGNKIGGHEYVDLGLPSGTLWATCNIGASNPEDYGDYFAWGETSTKRTYNWATYKYANGAEDKLTKYCTRSKYGYGGFTDRLFTLQVDDDPATANWGSGWRTPSKAQWDELLDNTTNQWTKRNGEQGRLFTAKNGQTLFVPAAGRCYNADLLSFGYCGDYWSRSLDNDIATSRARVLSFNSVYCRMYDADRCYGLSVRPVYSSQK